MKMYSRNVIILFLFLFSLSTEAKIVLIDPGHGGHENGAIGT